MVNTVVCFVRNGHTGSQYSGSMLQWMMLQWMNATMNDATMNECYNEWCYSEQFLSTKSGCYNKRGGILSANIERTCTWCVIIFVIVCKVDKRLPTDETPAGQSPKMGRNNDSSPSTSV